MAFRVNKENLPEKTAGGNPETMYIKAGNRLARFVSYVELGKHYQMFKGARAIGDKGKYDGKEKPPVHHVALTFEFPAEPHTGDYPLTISTTRRMKDGSFFDAVTIPDALIDNALSRELSMRTKFMKFLCALQDATGKDWDSPADFAAAQVGVMVNVTNKPDAQDPTKVYANMTPAGIVRPVFVNPVDNKETVFEVPPATGEYCAVFDWSEPTAEAWKALPSWHKKTIKEAVNFGGSPIDMLLQSNPELDKVMNEDSAEDHSAPVEPGDCPV